MKLTHAARQLVDLGLTVGEEEPARGANSATFDGFGGGDGDEDDPIAATERPLVT